MRSRSHPDHASFRTPRRLAAFAVATAAALGASALVVPAAHAATTEVQILATNDFHGRILNNTTNGEAGAAVLAGAVKQLRTEHANTVFAAAGDLIGASTFESFIQDDKPTIDALNAAGLEVSAVGNHELDQGYDDLINRVMAPYDAVTNPWGGAQWEYIAANLKVRQTGDPAVPATWIKEFGDVQVGFVGAVTEELPGLVSPGGIADIQVEGIVQSVNTEAAALVAEGADLVVMLVHEGAPDASCDKMDDGGKWTDIINTVSPDVDAIVSGHTHLAYNCSFPVPQWATEQRAVLNRPVVSAGQYGMNLNQLLFSVDGETGEVQGMTQNLLPLEATGDVPLYPADSAVAEIAAAAAAEAEVLGAVELGKIGGALNRAQAVNSAGARIENRGGESTLGNLVAEVQQWATESPESGAAQIAFMNPGGLRTDMAGTDPGDGSYPRTLTYKQAAVVQPFANTLVNMQLTGAQIKAVLEQQWQRDAYNALPTRPFLRLGASEGFQYTYTQETVTEVQQDNPATVVNEAGLTYQAPQGTVTGMWLNGEPIDPAASYSVTVNSFLSTGGDNFRELANGAGKRDTGKIDLTAMVDYMDAFASTTPLAVDHRQHAVEVAFPADAPATYELGSTVAFGVKSWTMSPLSDAKDTEVVVSLGGEALGSFPLDNTIGAAVYDDYGTASVSVALPADAPVGAAEFVLTGATTGTSVIVPITTFDRADSVTVGIPNKLIAKQKSAIQYTVIVVAEGGVRPTGEVTIYDGDAVIATATLTEQSRGIVKVKLPELDKGVHKLSASFAGSDAVRPSTSPKVPVLVY
ncbi:5'-nucleotidase C-terminal domain-containing protein [Microbacterium allomyrinae]|uniref:5'-nucleotidase C-terminal domain-containing protein n=1 Tax=Microbacterium allomyrinae TaxID=2830666 RepID=A0A9X1LTQ9_9MICO|nr:5'-nucleotidase C-terminal domain-containing protein [Microbacterium allomyrinae]MCC2031972.1 5'-nucleotidase C-terminal domain-containing protein [Microbacterium allomyrinae]